VADSRFGEFPSPREADEQQDERGKAQTGPAELLMMSKYSVEHVGLRECESVWTLAAIFVAATMVAGW
jgi:hypothetical protein